MSRQAGMFTGRSHTIAALLVTALPAQAWVVSGAEKSPVPSVSLLTPGLARNVVLPASGAAT